MSAALKWTLGAVVAAAVLLAGAWWAGWSEARSWPIRWLEVGGELERVTAEQVRAAVAGHARRGFFGVDVDAARGAVESLPWVHRATVARQWPDALSIRVVEQRAVARYNRTALVNAAGGLFRVAGTDSMQGLVDLAGPPDRHEQVVDRWRQIGEMLRPYGKAVSRVEVDARGSWRVVLAGGPELLLGRDQIASRLERYLSVHGALAEHGGSVRIDLRYPNGLSVAPAPAEPAGDAQRWADGSPSPERGVDPNHG